jgi:hypothetical protein
MDGYAISAYVEKLNLLRDPQKSHLAATGRISKVDHHHCIITDLTLWSDSMSDSLRSRFPGCRVTVRHTASSMTGFMVVVVMDKPSISKIGTPVLFLAMLSLLSLAMYYAIFDIFRV